MSGDITSHGILKH